MAALHPFPEDRDFNGPLDYPGGDVQVQKIGIRNALKQECARSLTILGKVARMPYDIGRDGPQEMGATPFSGEISQFREYTLFTHRDSFELME